ncbi:MAG: hypothetical protein ORN29_06095 [Rhodoferax sp.]|nr:hypothetical protein [Rhodoferax sp.]
MTALGRANTDLALEKAQEANFSLSRKSFSITAFIANFFNRAAAKAIHKQAHEVAVLAVWFKGAKVELFVKREEEHPHTPVKLLDTLEKTESNIATIRQKMLGYLKEHEQLPKPDEDFLGAVRTSQCVPTSRLPLITKKPS